MHLGAKRRQAPLVPKPQHVDSVLKSSSTLSFALSNRYVSSTNCKNAAPTITSNKMMMVSVTIGRIYDFFPSVTDVD